jgi:tape measure domain-containing protein
MAATELATAYLSLVPSMRGAQGAIARELSDVDADGIGKGIGSKMGGGITGTLKGLVGPALAGLAAVGFGGLIAEAAAASDATDKFKSTMNFAGIDTSGIEAATKAAKDYADQTVYDLPTIQATMAQLASNGVTNYTELTQAAGNLNAVAGGNAETFKSVSRTLTQSAGAGKLMTEDWNMLADAIPGASGPLQKAMKEAGAFEGNFKKAMENGEISSEEFQAALNKLGSDPIAVEAARSVTTFEGALGNLSATVNSGLMGALDALKPMITGAINGVATGLGAMFDFFGNLFTGLYALFVEGDISPRLLQALGVSEDSPVIAALYWFQGVIYDAYLGIMNFVAGFTMPEADAGKLWPQLTGMVKIGVIVRGQVEAILQGIRDFITGFTIPAPNLLDAGYIIGPMAAAGGVARAKAEEILGGIRDFITGFTIPTPALLAAGFDMGPMAQAGAIVRDSFESLKAAVGPVIPDFLALWSAISPVQTIFQALYPSLVPILAILGNLALVLGTSIVDAVVGILPAFQSLQATMVVLFTDVLSVALPVVAQLVQMLGATLAELIPVLVPIIVQVVNLAAALIGQLAPIFMTLVSAVMPMVVQSVGMILDSLVPLVTMVASVLIPVIQALMPVVVNVFTFMVGLITSAMQIIQGIIQVVTGIITGNWAQVWDGIGNIISGAWSFIANVIGGALALIGGLVSAGLAFVGAIFRNVWDGVIGFLGGVWGNITNGVSGMIGNVVGFFGGLIGKITGALGNAGSVLFQTGRDIIQGLINGISGMMGAIGRAVLNIVPQAIRGPFEDLLGIHSPSRVAIWWGHMIGDGLIGGIEDMYDPVAEAMSILAGPPELPAFASSYAVSAYADYARPNDTAAAGVVINQEVHPAEKMSEENLANVAARKITGALT